MFSPVTFTRRGQTRVADTLIEMNQLIWDGWTIQGGYVPDLTTAPITHGELADPNSQASQILADAYVPTYQLVLAPTPPINPDPGTVWINTSTT